MAPVTDLSGSYMQGKMQGLFLQRFRGTSSPVVETSSRNMMSAM